MYILRLFIRNQEKNKFVLFTKEVHYSKKALQHSIDYRCKMNELNKKNPKVYPYIYKWDYKTFEEIK